jgi:hypothetical protein
MMYWNLSWNWEVVLFTNDLWNKDKWNPFRDFIYWAWLLLRKWPDFQLNWRFNNWKWINSNEVWNYVWTLAFYVSEIILWNNNYELLFVRDFIYAPIWDNNRLILPNKDIVAIKKDTWLSLDDEKFLIEYYKKPHLLQNEFQDRYGLIQEKIQEHIVEMWEAIKLDLNWTGWTWWQIELF